MTEQTGITRAIEVLGDEIARKEAALRHVMNQRDDLRNEADELRKKNKELTEQLEQAKAAEAAASSYAVKLERLLEECREAYKVLKEGGADNCKKS